MAVATTGVGASPSSTGPMPLSLAMRRHTRKIHRRSDALVNLKLALAFSDRALYARAIALFQPLFERMEALLPKAAAKEPALRPIAELLLSGPTPVARTKAFEADLSFFLGPDWRTILGKTAPRPPALEAYLGRLEEAPPELLAVTVYHMYMALLSGGQILRRLTRAALGLDKAQPPTAASATIGGIGTAIYEFPAPAAELKERLRAAVDGMEAAVLARRGGGGGKGGGEAEASTLRTALLEESTRVFLQNNALVGTFDTGRRGKQAALLLVLVVLLVVGILASVGIYLIRAIVLGGTKG